jgi:flagellar biosynthesis activator protein FlaF
MSNNASASTNYRQPGNQGGSPRETEGRALLEAARRMADALASENPTKDICDAVRLNWRLWTIFQAELSTPGHEMAEALRINMLTLCNFVDKRTVEILASPKPQLVQVLVSINKNVGAGLLTNPNAAAPTATPSAPAADAGGVSA